MSGNALSAGVSGLQAHQKMLDIAGNNLANVNTTSFKASRITFSELLAETIKKASQATTNVGGTNPQQMGSGVGISGISPDMSQGNIVNTGNPLDMAIEGEGYFVLVDPTGQPIYTRAGAFGVDANTNLVDPSTGYLVQRIGVTGETDGFQVSGNNDISVPYDIAMAANATSTMSLQGNLGADAVLETPQKQKLGASSVFTLASDSSVASGTTTFADLEGFTSAGNLTIEYYDKDDTTKSTDTYAVTGTTTVNDLITHLNTLFTDATASLVNGRIIVEDNATGYSHTDLSIASAASGGAVMELPGYFELLSVGGDEVKSCNITIYDSLGGKHALSGAFVRTDTTNTWDFLMTSLSGDIYSLDIDDRRINGIAFDTDGSFDSCSDTAALAVTFSHDTSTEQVIELSLGTQGKWDGLTQFSGNSTAVAKEQDGYESGTLSSVSVDNSGVLIGGFSNGVKKQIATLKIALFQNPAGLESIGGGYYVESANSGDAVATQGLSGGAGSIYGGALEKSNADVATEFVNLIQAQNGYQANARTIRVANDILRELTSLIR